MENRLQERRRTLTKRENEDEHYRRDPQSGL